MNARELWSEFAEKTGVKADFEAWSYGDDADTLAELTAEGIKTATASAYELYAIDGEPLPEVGEYSVILDSRDEAVCIIKTTRVYIEKFADVSAEHAYREGEGDRSLEYWRRVHRDFFTHEYSEYGLTFNEEIKVVCEQFELVYGGKNK